MGQDEHWSGSEALVSEWAATVVGSPNSGSRESRAEEGITFLLVIWILSIQLMMLQELRVGSQVPIPMMSC